jgi:shikimate kinase
LKNLALIGFMGSGKTTVGMILSKRLKYSFIDVDRRIEESAGRTIPNIFAKEGESAFRNLETAELAKALKSSGAVISCGGGAVLRQENREALKRSALVIYLKAGPDEIFSRVGNTGDKRPLLQVKDPKKEIERLLTEREPLYIRTADIIIDTAGKSANAVAKQIMEELKAKRFQD